MVVVVMKFGGTSLATPTLVVKAAKKVLRTKRTSDVVIVVSAMGRTTDKLFAMSKQITLKPKARETDMLLTLAEEV